VLVSKTWADVVLPYLWETLKTDLVNTGSRDIRLLASTKSNILKHVRKMHILPRTTSSGEDHLPTLLAAVPRGQLCGFQSDRALAQSTVDILLRLHPNLVVFKLLTGSALANALASPWTEGCFTNLTSMIVYPNCFSRASLQKVWRECPGLLDMQLLRHVNFGSAELDEEDFIPSPDPHLLSATDHTPAAVVQHMDALKLQCLSIREVALPQTLDNMFQRIDALALQELKLDTFTGTSKLLEALASQFTHGQPCLKKLHIVRLAEQATEGVFASLLLLLTSFCGLQSFQLQCVNCDKVDVDGIINHGETLESLLVVNGGIHREDKARCYNASDLQKIATACPQLQNLCLNLYEIDPNRYESDVLGLQSDASHAPNAFEQALDVIATMSNLRFLRLTNPPNYRKAYSRPGVFVRWHTREVQSGAERYAFRARADGLMQYIGDRGSNLRLLSFSPTEDLEKAGQPDKHGHVWPTYLYTRVQAVDSQGVVVHFARPIAG